jgi:hypothetical protein
MKFRENTRVNLKVTVVSVPGKKKSAQKSLVTSLWPENHYHHEWQWLAATTSHWCHQLLTVAADKSIVIFSKVQVRMYTKNLHHKFLLHFQK